MGIQLREGEDINAYLDRRRAELLGGVNADINTNNTLGTSELMGDTTSLPPENTDPRGWFEKFAHKSYVNQRNRSQEADDLYETDPEAYFNQYGADASRILSALGGPATKGLNAISGFRKGVMSRVPGTKLASRLGIPAVTETPEAATIIGQGADEVTDIVALLTKGVASLDDAAQLGSSMWSKASLATKTPDDFARILRKVPAQYINAFYEGMGSKLVQAVRDMPRLTKSAQASLLSPSGRNVLRHTLRDMPIEEFDDLMRLLERGLWTEVRNKILKWGVALPLLAGTTGAIIRQFFK